MNFAQIMRSDVVSSIPLLLILSMAIFGGDPGLLIVVSLIVFIIANWDRLQWPSGRSLVMVLLIAQYHVLHLVKVVFFEDKPEGLVTAPVADPELWVWSLAGLVLIAPYLETFKGLRKAFLVLVPVVVLVGFVGLGADYANGSRYQCRVGFMNWDIFSTPLMMSGLALAWIGLVDLRRVGLRFVAIGLIVACLVSASSFAGVRGVLLAQIVVLSLFILYALVTRRLELAVLLLGGLIAGLVLGYLIDWLAGCSFAWRIQIVSSSAEASLAALAEVAAAADRSASLRFHMWADAIIAIKEAPLFGHGTYSEPSVADGNHLHVHNIYLSWLIWGGLLSLASGLLYIFAPLYAGLRTIFTKERFFGVCAISGLWAISMMFDSFLVWQHSNIAFLSFSLVIFKATEPVSIQHD